MSIAQRIAALAHEAGITYEELQTITLIQFALRLKAARRKS